MVELRSRSVMKGTALATAAKPRKRTVEGIIVEVKAGVYDEELGGEKYLQVRDILMFYT